MATLTATYLADRLGRVRLELGDALPNVRYRVERSTDAGATWRMVRGGVLATNGVTILDDYEYKPNIENRYRLIEPIFSDSFERTTPDPGSSWEIADTGQTWLLGGSTPGFNVYVDNGVGVIGSTSPNGFITEQLTTPISTYADAEITYSAIMPEPSLDHLVEFNVGIRATAFDNYYESRISFDDALATNPNSVHIRISKVVGGVTTALTSTTLQIGTWTPHVPWHVRFRTQGSLLLMRAWEDGSPEPRDWRINATDTDIPSGDGVHVRAWKTSGAAYEQFFGPMELHTVPPTVGATASVTPVQEEVILKSITFPSLNQRIECVDYQALTRNSRTGFFDIKGRHEILGVADVGSSASHTITFVTRSEAENRAIVALLTYGGVMLLQPPGDDETIACPVDFSGLPEGFVMVTSSVQTPVVYGQPMWHWMVGFTHVAAADAEGIIPTTITWEQLWAIIGPDGTWEDVWALWSTWQEVWSAVGDPELFGSGV